MTKFHTTTVKEDESGELYIELPTEMTERLGWNETTDLVWIVEAGGKIILRKRETNDSSHETRWLERTSKHREVP
jgi:bifunctional DNA-binding transcriptional regulator/antitoxin component of YhaV-PrlF toxin-antitoxin module